MSANDHPHDAPVRLPAPDGAPAIEIEPASPERWADVAAVMGERGDAAKCWCQFFHLSAKGWRTSSADAKRERLRHQVQAPAGIPPGVVAYADGRPIGWCAVAPRRSFPRLARSPLAKAAAGGHPGDATLGDGSATGGTAPRGTWAIVCFQVLPGARRKGVAARLLDGALDFARHHGAASVEAYSVDVTRRPRVTSAELYRGTLSMFLRAGFEEIARPYPARVVVRRELERA